jgi:flagellar basal-body rod protein FlgG
MNPALWAAKTGLDAQQTKLAVTSNNLANVSTSGFKKGRAVFEDLLYQNVRQVGGSTSQDTEAPSGVHLGTGVRVVATEKLYTQGGLTQTDNALDVPSKAAASFQIQMPDGTTPTPATAASSCPRRARWSPPAATSCSPASAFPKARRASPSAATACVSVRVAGQPAPVQVGQLQLTDFVNPAGLQPLGENLLAETVAAARRRRARLVRTARRHHAGSVEASNVNVVEELVNMIETQRAYEMNSKAISTATRCSNT